MVLRTSHTHTPFFSHFMGLGWGLDENFLFIIMVLVIEHEMFKK